MTSTESLIVGICLGLSVAMGYSHLEMQRNRTEVVTQAQYEDLQCRKHAINLLNNVGKPSLEESRKIDRIQLLLRKAPSTKLAEALDLGLTEFCKK